MNLQDLIPQLALALAAVLALMALLAFLAKRFGLKAQPGARDGLQIRATLSLGSREKLVVVAYGGQDYLLGVTASTISAINTTAQVKPAPQTATTELSACD